MAPIKADDKPILREWAKARRGAIDSPGVLDTLTALPEWQAARHVLLYLALPGEIVVETLTATARGKRFYAPRRASGRHLTIHPFVPGETSFAVTAFGLREPPPDAPQVSPETLDLVIVPALLFDEIGNRLGYGGGYYDRFLPTLRGDCVTVGVAGDGLIVPTLPTEPHDVPVAIVVTASRTFRRADMTAPTPRPCSD